MDTKLKNNKKISFFIAGALVAAAVILSLAAYPLFEKRAAEYFTERIYSNAFLEEVYQSNYVLYKDIKDKTDQKNYSYEELFLDIQEKISDDFEQEGGDFDYRTTIEEQKQNLKRWFAEYMASWQTSAADGFMKEIDYCVIDHQTGEIIKNTGREIEKLAGDEYGEWEEDYTYYLIMTYDNAGNVKDISVRGKNADELLKNVQSVMRSNLLDKSFTETMQYYYQYTKEFYGYYQNGLPGEILLNYKAAPKNVTYIYGLTEKQQENISGGRSLSDSRETWRWVELDAYYKAGAGNFYFVILLLLAAAALLFTKSKNYCLHRLEGFHMQLEVSVIALVLLLGSFFQTMIWLMNYSNRGYFSKFYSSYIVGLPTQLYGGVTLIINSVFLILFYGAWYYFITTLSNVFYMGPAAFLKERSLVVKLFSWCLSKVKGAYRKVKQELLHVDLGSNKKTNKILKKILFYNFLLLSLICFIWMFGWMILIPYSAALYYLIRKYLGRIQEQYRMLLEATGSIAAGNLNTGMEEDWGIFESYKEKLETIQEGFRKAVNEEVKSQKMKTELITNVSHDLKTPLTAITTYIELLKEENITEEQRKEYIAVLERKSLRLKLLIEDLFEVSKASSGNVVLNPVEVDICNLLRQAYLEYEDKVEEANLIFRFQIPEERIVLKLDSQKTYRIFENLYINIIKYAMSGTRAYINAEKTEKGVRIELKNMSATELNINPAELTERFVRGDSARNTEGSGLGLAIARSFTELQGGKMTVEIDGDLFKVILEWQETAFVN